MGRAVGSKLFMWAGGKGKMLARYAPFLDGLDGLPYVEPFAGGAAMFEHLRRRGCIAGARLSDSNSELIGLYTLVRDDPDYLIAALAEREAAWMPLSTHDRKALYYRLREIYWGLPEGPAATALLYFLMKTGFNGIWQTCKASGGRFGTAVGLANQKDAVFSAATVRAWSALLRGTEIQCCSYADRPVTQRSFVYCDPPYRASFTSYGAVFDDAEQLRLIDWCREVHRSTGSTVWLCNRDAGDGFFETHAPDAALHRFPITYTAGRRARTEDGFLAKPATELLMIWR